MRLFRGVFPVYLLVLGLGCQPPVDQPTTSAEEYIVYSAYLSRFQFYKNVPRKDTVLIEDSASLGIAVIDPHTPWSWVANNGDRCKYVNDPDRCYEAHSPVWEPLFAGIKQLPHQPGHRLTARFSVPFTTRFLSATRINQSTFSDQLSERDPSTQRATYLFKLSPVVYNQERTKALFFGSFFCGGTCGRGELVMLKKVDQEWVLIDTFRFWIA